MIDVSNPGRAAAVPARRRVTIASWMYLVAIVALDLAVAGGLPVRGVAVCRHRADRNRPGAGPFFLDPLPRPASPLRILGRVRDRRPAGNRVVLVRKRAR